MNTKDQLTMNFENAGAVPPHSRRQRRLSRAHWWFDQMRLVVDQAFDRHARMAPPEQIYFPLQGSLPKG